MRSKFFLLTILLLLGSQSAFSKMSYEVTAILPGNEFIWPLPEVETDRKVFLLKTEFIEREEILSVTQGNWENITYLVRYKILEKDKRYKYDELSFIVKDRWPTKESNIRVKKLQWPFKEGEKIFYLTRDNSCIHKQFFKILTYSHEN